MVVTQLSQFKVFNLQTTLAGVVCVFLGLTAGVPYGTAEEQTSASVDLSLLQGVIKDVYGAFPKTAEHEAADHKFVEAALADFPTRDTATRYALELAWQSYCDGDEQTALKRFNQAWLLTPNHPEPFHGFAVYMLEKGRIDEAIALSKKALELDPRHARAMCTLARAYAAQGRDDASMVFQQASQATELDSDLIYIYYHWARWLAKRGDMAGSADKFALYRSHGGRELAGEWLVRALARLRKPAAHVQ